MQYRKININSHRVDIEKLYTRFCEIMKTNRGNPIWVEFIVDKETPANNEVPDYNASEHLSNDEIDYLIKTINGKFVEHNDRLMSLVVPLQDEVIRISAMHLEEMRSVRMVDDWIDRDFQPKKYWKSSHWAENAPKRKKR